MSLGCTRTAGILVGLSLLVIVGPSCAQDEGERGREGQKCLEGGYCYPGLVCTVGECRVKPDGGVDGGDEDPCAGADCSAPGPAGQGVDTDGDAWGSCCDCDDGDGAVHPGAVEQVYNGKDDDCDVESLDDDLDQDGHDSTATGGTDCADDDPDVYLGAEEDCNAVDDSCDGQTDEGLQDQPCPLAEGVCQGVIQTCLGAAGWSICDYGPDYEQGAELSCDRLDNDCDGLTDEDDLIRLEPELGLQASDGVDNNCNGLIDEPGGVVVPVPNRPGTWIDAYEGTVFDNPDCTGARYGELADDYPVGWPSGPGATTTLYACSLSGLVPSGHLSWYRARRACEAQGKRLCSITEYGQACGGGVSSKYPYSAIFVPGVCNDPIGGVGQAVATGSLDGCTADGLTFDLSGNLAEWVADWHPSEFEMGRVGGYGFSCLLCVFGEFCHMCSLGNPDDVNLAQGLSDCFITDGNGIGFPIAQARDFFGTRCCLDGP